MVAPVDLRELGLGRGIYALSEASRITSIPAPRLRRWVRGYWFQSVDGHRRSGPVFGADYVADEDAPVQLSFADLIEIRLINGFRDLGVGWREIRRAQQAAADLLGCSHPFTTFEFLTDGRRIFAEMRDELTEPQMIELATHQRYFNKVIRPYLRGLEFEDGIARRWWPMGERTRVLVDPSISFGRPSGSESGIPTCVLASQAKTNGIPMTAEWYEVREKEVRDAVRYEQQLAK